MINRRRFLFGSSALALTATFSPIALSAASFFRRDTRPPHLTYAAFCKCLGSSFVVQCGTAAEVVLDLTHVRQQAASPLAAPNAPDADHEKFSLLFRGTQSAGLPQNTYTFEHSQMGRFEMFIVPVGPKDKMHGYYQAIFNRPPGRSVAA